MTALRYQDDLRSRQQTTFLLLPFLLLPPCHDLLKLAAGHGTGPGDMVDGPFSKAAHIDDEHVFTQRAAVSNKQSLRCDNRYPARGHAGLKPLQQLMRRKTRLLRQTGCGPGGETTLKNADGEPHSKTMSGVQLGTEADKASRMEALRAITINGAYEYFMEDKLGSIESGKLADLVILDRDPLTIPSEDLRNVKVLKTYVGGKEVYSA